MGVAVMLIMWPRCAEQTFIPPPPAHEGSISNLGLIGPMVSEEKTFKECGRRTADPAYTIIWNAKAVLCFYIPCCLKLKHRVDKSKPYVDKITCLCKIITHYINKFTCFLDTITTRCDKIKWFSNIIRQCVGMSTLYIGKTTCVFKIIT